MSNETAKRALDRAANPGRVLTEAAAEGKVSMTGVLHAVGLDPANPTHQAALLACEKYGLDPLLKHLIVIPKGGTYITRDGWLHIAHRSGVFDGMVVDDTGRDDDKPGYWWAEVSVYRKDMSHPFRYRGRYPLNGHNNQYGPEMAVKVAEVAALRRAFPVDVAGVGAFEERWDITDSYEESEPTPAPVEIETDDGTLGLDS